VKKERLENQVQLVFSNVKEDNIVDKNLLLYIINKYSMGFFGMLIRVTLQFWTTLLIPFAITRLLDYAAVEYGFEVPWPLDMLFVPAVTFMFLWIIATIMNTQWYTGKCGIKGRNFLRIPVFSFLQPALAVGGSFAMNFIPFLKLPLILVDKIIFFGAGGLRMLSFIPGIGLAADILEGAAEGAMYLPGYFIAMILLTPIMALAVKC